MEKKKLYIVLGSLFVTCSLVFGMYISVFTANTWNKTSVTVNKNQSSVPNSTLGQCDPPIKAVQSSVQPSTSNKSLSVSTPDADPNAVE